MVFTYRLLQELMWGWVLWVQQPELHGINRGKGTWELTLNIQQGLGRQEPYSCGKLRFTGVFPTLFLLRKKKKAFKHTAVINRAFTPRNIHRLRYFLPPDKTQYVHYRCVCIPLRNRPGWDSCGQIMGCFLCIHEWNGIIGFTWFRDQIRPCLKEQTNYEWEQKLQSIQVGKQK